ncbi:transposase [Chloroflexi bacterium TSY]|nr:transposase [Chloroflexi bacterium TSY]
MVIKVRSERQMRAVTGLSEEQFKELVPHFSKAYAEHKDAEFVRGFAKGTRQRKSGGGQKGKLPTMEDKLFFVLYYYKVYPTFDAFGLQFDMAGSKANENLHKLSPILYTTLVNLGVMPHRSFRTPEELEAALKDVDQIIIDATERPVRRSVNDEKQRDHFSGKKKRHMLKNTVMSTKAKFILFLGHTFSGSNHDYAMLKQEFPPNMDWFEHLQLLVDLGYQGILSDYKGDDIHLPHKKPRKSKKNPAPQLSDEQLAENRTLSKLRIYVENAIGGFKRYNILVDRFRNHMHNFDDHSIAISSALWNFSLSY